MTAVQISLLISGLALIIALWARFEGFITTRRSRIIDRLKRIGECIDLATELNCKTEDFERLYKKLKPTSTSTNSNAVELVNWEKRMSDFKNLKEVTQAFIDSAHQYLEDLKKRKKVKLSQIEFEAFLSEFQSIKILQQHLFTLFENLIIEEQIQLGKIEELKSKNQILRQKRDELVAKNQMLLDKKNNKKQNSGILKKIITAYNIRKPD
jgi:hypothetical protein